MAQTAVPPVRLCQITVHCERCGHPHPVERTVWWGEIVNVICHRCELLLTATWAYASWRGILRGTVPCADERAAAGREGG